MHIIGPKDAGNREGGKQNLPFTGYPVMTKRATPVASQFSSTTDPRDGSKPKIREFRFTPPQFTNGDFDPQGIGSG
ncbi:hypothetical protein BLL41_14950 [Bacillus sp. FMQ74]|nr:hypothetical protein BLL41_14950 [Bacillus sp. FMQ74]